ncbi:hypothetical protein D3C75_1207430 [compost metagenome]
MVPVVAVPTAATAAVFVAELAVSIRSGLALRIAAARAAFAASTHSFPTFAVAVLIFAAVTSNPWAHTSNAVFAGPAAAITSANLARNV